MTAGAGAAAVMVSDGAADVYGDAGGPVADGGYNGIGTVAKAVPPVPAVDAIDDPVGNGGDAYSGTGGDPIYYYDYVGGVGGPVCHTGVWAPGEDGT